jgi:hypothetical protein
MNRVCLELASVSLALLRIEGVAGCVQRLDSVTVGRY